MKFSQRIGVTPIKSALQIESIDEDLRNRIWNVFLRDFFELIDESDQRLFAKQFWSEFYNKPLDTVPKYAGRSELHIGGFLSKLRSWYFHWAWHEVYDFIEFVVDFDNVLTRCNFAAECNEALNKEVARYRIVDDKIVQITSTEEIQEIEEALNNTDEWESVNSHLNSALAELSNRNTPNYRNSIKESISAVESLCKLITGDDKATLGNALSEIEKKHPLHKALKTAFSALYGYTSDSGGIRHSKTESDKNEPLFEDAKFMLVTCSAFINYLKVKAKL